MHRFFLPPERVTGASLRLDEAESRHAAQVLRLRPGDAAVVLDGAGREFHGVVAAGERRAVRIEVQFQLFHPQPPVRLILFQSIPKGKTMDWIVQKATELGAHTIVPLLTERTVVHLVPNQFRAKRAKWRTQAVEAIKQCGAPWCPAITLPCTMIEALEQLPAPELSVVGVLTPAARHPREVLAGFRRQHARLPRSLGLWIGPEGDFTPGELHRLCGCGVQPITLGSRILRAETAAVAGLAILLSEFT